jgi:hypothetical protein
VDRPRHGLDDKSWEPAELTQITRITGLTGVTELTRITEITGLSGSSGQMLGQCVGIKGRELVSPHSQLHGVGSTAVNRARKPFAVTCHCLSEIPAASQVQLCRVAVSVAESSPRPSRVSVSHPPVPLPCSAS